MNQRFLMKKALKMLLVWAVWLIIGIAVITLFYSLYLHSLGLVAGQKSSVFTKFNLFSSFFVAAEMMTLLIGFFLISYRISDKGGALQIIAFVLTQILTWGLLFPWAWYTEKNFKNDNHAFIWEQKNERILSKGYFRESGNNIYYFMDDMKPYYKADEEGVTSIKIDTQEEGVTEIVEINLPGKLDVVASAAPYKDILIKESFEKTNGFSPLMNLIEIGKRDILRGWTYWLGFASLGFALASLIALSSVSKWRIVDFSITGILYFGVLITNSLFWSTPFEKLRNMNFMHSGIFNIPAAWTSSPFLIVVNLTFGLVVILAGVLHSIKEHRKNK